MKQPRHTVVQGKSISKSDKELVEAILGGEMQDAWRTGDGIDARSSDGPYSKTRKGVSRQKRYRDNYDNIKWKDKKLESIKSTDKTNS